MRSLSYHRARATPSTIQKVAVALLSGEIVRSLLEDPKGLGFIGLLAERPVPRQRRKTGQTSLTQLDELHEDSVARDKLAAPRGGAGRRLAAKTRTGMPPRRASRVQLSARHSGCLDQDRLVGPFGEQLRAGGRRASNVAVVACRPLGMRHLAR